MNNQAFSKIWIIVVLVVLIGGGIFAWQYFGVSEKEATGDETANWETFIFNTRDLQKTEGLTQEKQEEVEKKITERKLESCGFEIKYPPDWNTYTWPLHGVIVPEGLIIEEKSNGCSFSMSFYANPEKERYCFPISYSSGESDSSRCNQVFNQMLSTFKLVGATKQPEEVSNKEKYCVKDTDCACGVKINTRDCFYGNKDYVDIIQQCPDFCAPGFSGRLILKCIDNECKQVLE